MLLAFISCKSKPTIIEEESALTNQEDNSAATGAAAVPNIHEVKVIDFQQTVKYTYVHVQEGTKTFCVAVPLTNELKKNHTYFFKGGIIMANPENLNFKEKFESVMISPGFYENSGDLHSAASTPVQNNEINPQTNIKNIKLLPVPGTIKLEDIFKNPEQYNGKQIKVHGYCVKSNRMIMNKNWLHIQDYTKNKTGQLLDLTITTLDDVQLGDVVVFEGTLNLNKDFGAGYKYDLILEDAKLINNR